MPHHQHRYQCHRTLLLTLPDVQQRHRMLRLFTCVTCGQEQYAVYEDYAHKPLDTLDVILAAMEQIPARRAEPEPQRVPWQKG